ncbi:L-asparaginase-like protein GE13669 [Drosophila serrata]|uniref:L-asparaginase-like protein GE13669 n=1 Tax=Drosophila serrata TaxID=7274 RepID=UPI000A1D2396|nr:L-asparaginase-like protein GE13669 [Drosophila serrata]
MRFSQSCCLQVLILLLLLLKSPCTVQEKLRKYFWSSLQNKTIIKPKIHPLVISTWNYRDANLQAWSVLKEGPRRTRQAVIQGCLACQHKRCGRLLAEGSAPDEEGNLTVEAALMDGETLEFGAVAALEGIRQAILVADAVLRYTKHSLIVGKSAAIFARSLGYQENEIPSSRFTKKVLKRWRLQHCQPNFWRDVRPSPTENCGPYYPLPEDLLHWQPMRQEYHIQEGQHDHIAFLALDDTGHLHVASHSSGARFRIPGRVGDSAVPGAGIYADNEVGGAVVSGDGDVLMRHLPAFLAVEALRAGHNTSEAAELVIHRLLKHNTEFNGGIVVVTRLGSYAAACAGLDEFQFVVSGGHEYLSMARVERIKCVERSIEIIVEGPTGHFLRIPEKINGNA